MINSYLCIIRSLQRAKDADRSTSLSQRQAVVEVPALVALLPLHSVPSQLHLVDPLVDLLEVEPVVVALPMEVALHRPPAVAAPAAVAVETQASRPLSRSDTKTSIIVILGHPSEHTHLISYLLLVVHSIAYILLLPKNSRVYHTTVHHYVVNN